jgi:hypothetical protein
MKYPRLIIYILIFFVVKVNAQQDYKLMGRLDTECNFLAADPLGNVYIIQGQNIRKFNNNFQKIADYSNVYLGNISFADVSDPLRIMLYYSEFNQVVWLDNFFQELRSPVRLDDLGIDQAILVCSSNLGGFWVFDQLNNQLQYFDKNLKKINESIRLNPVIGEMKPLSMIEKNRMVYIYFPGMGILTFDQFGTYSRILPVFPDNYFQVTDESIYYLQDSSFKRYNLTTFKEEKLILPDTSALQAVLIQSEYFYIQKKDCVFIYKSSLLYQ